MVTLEILIADHATCLPKLVAIGARLPQERQTRNSGRGQAQRETRFASTR